MIVETARIATDAVVGGAGRSRAGLATDEIAATDSVARTNIVNPASRGTRAVALRR